MPLDPEDGEGGTELSHDSAGGQGAAFRQKNLPARNAQVAYQFLDRRTGGVLLVAPDVCAVNKGLRDALKNSDAILLTAPSGRAMN